MITIFRQADGRWRLEVSEPMPLGEILGALRAIEGQLLSLVIAPSEPREGSGVNEEGINEEEEGR